MKEATCFGIAVALAATSGILSGLGWVPRVHGGLMQGAVGFAMIAGAMHWLSHLPSMIPPVR